MSLYSLDTDFIGANLLPTSLRKALHLAWIKVILKPLSILFDKTFLKYKDGDTITAYNNGTTYVFGDTVKYTDKSIYECIVASSTGVNPSNITNWVKLNDIFIGTDERVKYTAQKLLFEYALNRYFEVPITDPKIYITRNVIYTTPFVMGNSGSYSSNMPNNSLYSTSFLGTTYTFSSTSVDYTIHIPSVLFTSLGTTLQNRENAIRNFADKYNLAGITYQIITY